MKAWLSPLARLLAGATSVVAFLLVVGIIAGGAVLYLATHGKSIIVLRQVASFVGTVLDGQHTDHLKLAVRIDPARHQLQATAHLEVHATDAPRRRFFFLLNDALRLEGVRVTSADDTPLAAELYRFGLLVVVELDEAIAAQRQLHLTLTYAGDPSGGILGDDSVALSEDRVLLGADAFWYPFDAQSFFTVEASVTLPARLKLVQNAADVRVVERGTTQEVHWTSERPVPGLALVAGLYDVWEERRGGSRFRLYRAADIGIEPAPTLDAVSEAHALFTDLYGPSGFSTYSVVLDTRVRRAFNDGSGLMVISPRYFRTGDSGFHILAHELAHVWWGGTIAETWLQPSSGGQWIVEGLASGSAILASRERYGEAGGVRARLDHFFDPENQHVVRDMSFLDNVLTEGVARDTIYRKGGFAVAMLYEKLGRAKFAAGMQLFLERFRYRQATDVDVQKALEEATSTPLDVWFDDWLRSEAQVDLGLEASAKGPLSVVNRGLLPVADDLTLALVHPDGSVERRNVKAADEFVLTPDVDHAVLDPDLQWADMRRGNNRHPSVVTPRYVAAVNTQTVVVVDGQRHDWDRSTVRWQQADGRDAQHWDFERTPLTAPRVAPDGKSVVVALSRPAGLLPSLFRLDKDGAREPIGVGHSPAFLADGSLLAAVDDAIVRHTPNGAASVLLQQTGWHIETLLPAPGEQHILYVAVRGARQQIRVYGVNDGQDELLHESERDRTLVAWGADGSVAYVVLGHDAHWRILRMPLVDATPTIVADDITSVVDIEIAPGGVQLALTASAAPAYPDPRHVLYVLDLVSQRVNTVDVPGIDLGDLTWINGDELVVVGRQMPTPGGARLPEVRQLLRIRPSTATISEFP